MNIPPINPTLQVRDQVILEYLTAATDSADAALKVRDGNPATGSPGMSEQAKDQNYALVRAAMIDAALNTSEIIGENDFPARGKHPIPRVRNSWRHSFADVLQRECPHANYGCAAGTPRVAPAFHAVRVGSRRR